MGTNSKEGLDSNIAHDADLVIVLDEMVQFFEPPGGWDTIRHPYLV